MYVGWKYTGHYYMITASIYRTHDWTTYLISLFEQMSELFTISFAINTVLSTHILYNQWAN